MARRSLFVFDFVACRGAGGGEERGGRRGLDHRQTRTSGPFDHYAFHSAKHLHAFVSSSFTAGASPHQCTSLSLRVAHRPCPLTAMLGLRSMKKLKSREKAYKVSSRGLQERRRNTAENRTSVLFLHCFVLQIPV